MCAAGRSGTNNSAIFSEIVPEQLRSAIYAFDRSFEGAVGATAAPLVGARAPARPWRAAACAPSRLRNSRRQLFRLESACHGCLGRLS